MQVIETANSKSNYPIDVQKVAQSRLPQVDLNDIPFGRVFTDHMFVSDFYEGDWRECKIVPFGKFQIHPATTALHYGQSIFEGMKAFKDQDGNPQLFRPEMNHKRMNFSARRMAMPELPAGVYMEGLKKLIAMEKDWIPTSPGSAMYIRPFMFATDEYVGIKPADNFKFIIFCLPVGEYYAEPVKVVVAEKYVRAIEGGVGNAKAAGNYAATLMPVIEAKRKGFDQILWVDGNDFNTVHEVGTMNIFFRIGDQVITPSLDQGTILNGVTRNSVITLVQDRGLEVVERKITMDEIKQAADAGMLLDMFGTGTAATVALVESLNYNGENLKIPAVADRELSNGIKTELEEIKVGLREDRHNWNLKV